MWIETQDCKLINLDNGVEIKKIASAIQDEHLIIWIQGRNSEICGEYANESDAAKAFDDFKNKLRRNGEKIFKFKGDVEK